MSIARTWNLFTYSIDNRAGTTGDGVFNTKDDVPESRCLTRPAINGYRFNAGTCRRRSSVTPQRATKQIHHYFSDLERAPAVWTNPLDPGVITTSQRNVNHLRGYTLINHKLDGNFTAILILATIQSKQKLRAQTPCTLLQSTELILPVAPCTPPLTALGPTALQSSRP